MPRGRRRPLEVIEVTLLGLEACRSYPWTSLEPIAVLANGRSKVLLKPSLCGFDDQRTRKDKNLLGQGSDRGLVPLFGCGQQLGFEDVYVFRSGNSRMMSASQTMLILRRVLSTVPSRNACWRLAALESPTSCARVRALRMSWFHWLGAEAARLGGAGLSFRGFCIVVHW